MLLSELIKDVDALKIKGNLDIEVTGISYNSKEVVPGDLFVCITGFKVDGHIFAEDAVARGAVAVMSEHDMDGILVANIVTLNTRLAMSKVAARFYDFPERKLKIIGITGTNGKTTTTYIVKSILEEHGEKVGLIGTNQNLIGDIVVPSKHTTPESLELMQLFAKMVEENVDVVVMEISSHSLELQRVSGIHFDVGAFTNITQDHLDFHGTMEKYLGAKSKLFNMCDIGIINADDKVADYLKDNATCKIIEFGIHNTCNIIAENIELHPYGVNFTAKFGLDKANVSLSIPGEFSVYNALTAIGCCTAYGLDFKTVCGALSSARGVRGRAEVVETGRDFSVIIDYAHTPDGLINILKTVRGFAKGRIITVFGCGGDRDKGKRPLMGKVAGELSDFCVVTSDNPRSENPSSIIDDILVGVVESGCLYEVVENRREAIAYSISIAKEDDIILLAGKGHETYQILADKTIDFDERVIVGEILC